MNLAHTHSNLDHLDEVACDTQLFIGQFRGQPFEVSDHSISHSFSSIYIYFITWITVAILELTHASLQSSKKSESMDNFG